MLINNYTVYVTTCIMDSINSLGKLSLEHFKMFLRIVKEEIRICAIHLRVSLEYFTWKEVDMKSEGSCFPKIEAPKFH